MLERILVATDFSTRSDRALRRGVLLARQASAGLVVAHIVDDDQPHGLVQAERQESTALLHDLAQAEFYLAMRSRELYKWPKKSKQTF